MPSTESVVLEAAGCITAFGDAATTHAALLRGERALELRPVLGADGGEAVPRALAGEIPVEGGGTANRPVFVTSSNFGVGSLYAFRRHGDEAHLAYGTPAM